MINKKLKEVIILVAKKLKKVNIKWALIGSTNLTLQGLNILPHDLDIVVESNNLRKIKKIFEEFKLSEFKETIPMTDKPVWEMRLNIMGVDVQIFGEKNNGIYVSKLLANKLTYVGLENIEIPCFSLEAEMEAYSEKIKYDKSKRDSKKLWRTFFFGEN